MIRIELVVHNFTNKNLRLNNKRFQLNNKSLQLNPLQICDYSIDVFKIKKDYNFIEYDYHSNLNTLLD
jgi:hypothetical protein